MQALEKITEVAGREIEMTIRGERSFTFSFDGKDEAATQKIINFFGDQAKLEVQNDEDCGTFIYVEV